MQGHAKTVPLLGAVALLTGACGSAVAPQAQLTDAQSTISAAEAKGAQDVPKASLYLKMARDGVAQAQQLMENGENKRAAEVLRRARIDAELARSITVEADVKKKAEEQIERVNSLQQANARMLAKQERRG